MEIKASELMSGKRIPFEQIPDYSGIIDRYLLLWNKKRERYEIVDCDKPKYVFWFSNSIFAIIKHVNTLSQQHYKAVDDSREFANYTGDIVDWKTKIGRVFKNKK